MATGNTFFFLVSVFGTPSKKKKKTIKKLVGLEVKLLALFKMTSSKTILTLFFCYVLVFNVVFSDENSSTSTRQPENLSAFDIRRCFQLNGGYNI